MQSFHLIEGIHKSLFEITRRPTMIIMDKYVVAVSINSDLPKTGKGSRLNDISDLFILACGDLRKL